MYLQNLEWVAAVAVVWYETPLKGLLLSSPSPSVVLRYCKFCKKKIIRTLEFLAPHPPSPILSIHLCRPCLTIPLLPHRRGAPPPTGLLGAEREAWTSAWQPNLSGRNPLLSLPLCGGWSSLSPRTDRSHAELQLARTSQLVGFTTTQELACAEAVLSLFVPLLQWCCDNPNRDSSILSPKTLHLVIKR
jgi:hypothetical protein